MAATAPVKSQHPWKNKWLKVILQKKSVRSKKWMAGRDSSLQIKWHTALKKWTTPGVVLKKIYIAFRKINASNRFSLTVAVPKNYSFPE